MGRYVFKRLLMLIPVTLGVVFIVFTILRMSPNDPIRTILGDMASQEEVEAMREEVGLNDPFLLSRSSTLVSPGSTARTWWGRSAAASLSRCSWPY